MQDILVLVPAEDRAGRALSLAARLAEESGAKIKLIRVLEENLGPAASTELCQERVKIRDLLRDVETEQLEEMARALRGRTSDVTAHVRWGVPWEVLLEEAQAGEHDQQRRKARRQEEPGHVQLITEHLEDVHSSFSYVTRSPRVRCDRSDRDASLANPAAHSLSSSNPSRVCRASLRLAASLTPGRGTRSLP